MIDLWNVDINEDYYVDDDDRIWASEEEFCEYYFDEYHGTKDDYEDWCTQLIEDHDLKRYSGHEILQTYIKDMEETIEVYRGR